VRIDPEDAAAIMVVCGRGLRQWHPVITRNRPASIDRTGAGAS
jgi:hypothetical protein